MENNPVFFFITGYYAYIEASAPRKPGDKAILQSTSLKATSASCLSFWYFMYGAQVGSLSVRQEYLGSVQYGTAIPLWSMTGNTGQKWIQASVNVSSRVEYILTFTGVEGQGFSGDIAIDDITLTTGSCSGSVGPTTFSCGDSTTYTQSQQCDFNRDCTNGADEKNCGNCTFDGSSGLCGWFDNSAGSFRWERHNNGTETANTGPSSDHTYGDATHYYMYVDASNGISNSRATLRGPTLQQAADTCQMTFYYHMYGTRIGRLYVYIVTGGSQTLLANIYGSHGNQWNSYTVNIGRRSAPFNIEFRAFRSYTVIGDIGIDDVSFINCGLPPIQSSCTSNQFTCQRGSCVDMSRVCDFTDDCGDNTDEVGPNAHCDQLPARCDFSSSICDWVQDRGDKFDWSRRNSPTPSVSTGPTRDHSTGLRTGGYIYIESSRPRSQGDNAILLSSMYNTAQSQDMCTFTFYYNMNGQTMGTLNVYTKDANNHISQVYTVSGNRGDVWVKTVVNLVSPYPFQVLLEGVVGNGYFSDIAIDDTVFSKGCHKLNQTFATFVTIPPTAPTANPCGSGKFQCADQSTCIPTQKVCDWNTDCTDGSDEATCGPCNFENGICGWKDLSTGRFNWSRHAGSQNSGNAVGPLTDHSTNTSAGYYAYVEGTYGVFLSRAVLQSPSLPPAADTCEMYFYYNLNGRNTLIVSAVVNNTKKSLSLLTGNFGSSWQKATGYIGQAFGQINGTFNILFEVLPSRSLSASASSDVAIDDITFANCYPQAPPPNLQCNFSTDFCNWNQAIDDDFDWTRLNGTTKSVGTGPRFDHTTGTGQGYYAYIETSAPRHRGDVAILDSANLPPTPPAGHCLTFWYYMFGNNIGSLNVYMVTNTNRTLFWSRNGTQGDAWKMAQRQIFSNTDFRISVYGVVGNGYQGDIAIDDFNITNGACPPQPGCDFEEGNFCDWTNSLMDDFDWTIGQNGTASVGTGPPYDHTFGSSTGHFAYIESSAPRQPNDQAILVSKFLDGGAARCLRFWYHMYGASIGSLNVYQGANGSQIPDQVWTRNGNQENLWRRATVPLKQLPGKQYQILIKGVRGVGYTGDIAIDDLLITDGQCPPDGSCDFEQDTCGWTNALSGDNFDWLRDNGGTPSATTGPSVDHTLGTKLGYYMYIESSGANRKVGEKAWLVSDILTRTVGNCLYFWYHMYGAGIGSLKIYKQDFFNKQKTMVFSLSGNQGNAWHQASVNFVSDHEYTVIFEGVYGGNYTGDIAIDDVLITASPCSATSPTPAVSMATTPAVFPKTAVDCDFESGFCSWNQDVGDDFNWSMTNGKTSSGNTGPLADHTLKNNLGHYIYIEVSGKLPNTTARVISPSVYVTSAGVCLKFWYNMYGAHVNNLNLYYQGVSASSTKHLLWNKHGNQGSDWKYAQVHLQNQGQAKFVFEGVAGVSYQGDIALDDITLNQGLCPGSPTCDFEDGMCGYTQDVSDQFDWTLHTSKTVSTFTGPISDHTYGTPLGHYLYIESSAPRRSGDKARIDSPSYPATTGTGSCLTFWYSMYGRSIGALNVYLRQGTSSQLQSPIWTMSGNQGNAWRVAQTTITSAIAFRMTFEGVVGNGYQGDIAIDDVQMTMGACQPAGSCDFESGLCTWTNAQGNDTFDWQRTTGSTPSYGTGPTIDHTLQTIYGSFMYIEATAPRTIGDKAWLVSQTFESVKTPVRCMSFWYNMNGVQMGSLNIYQYFFTAPLPKQVYTISGNQGKLWKQAKVEFTATNRQDYQILVEGMVGGVLSDMAIDDILITSGHCTNQTVNPTCPFKCSNGLCLDDIRKVCDFNSDCPSGEDEANCGFNCNFEPGQAACKWNSTSSGFTWVTSQGSSSSQNTNKPSTDHTTLGPNGYYMYVAPKTGVYSRLADLTSPVIGQSSSTCQLSFWYHMKGSQILQVYLKELSGFTRTRIFFLSGDQGNVWKQAIVPIGRMHSQFQVIITGQRTYSGVGDIAVDDINFQGCAFPTSSSCNSFVTFKCTSGACVSQSRVCDYSDDCGDNTDESNTTCNGYNRCNFEYGLCDWTQLTDDDLDWTLRKGPTPSASTGPSKDHTLNSNAGHYLYLETSSPVRQGQKARIASRAFQASTSQPYCQFRFFYFMYGRTVDNLTVYYRNQINGPLFKVLSVHGNVGAYYARQIVNIRSSAPFQVVVEATAGASYLSDIAIDDVSFSSDCHPYSGNLPMGTPATTVPTTLGPCKGGHQCGDMSCVAPYQVCDFIPQCSDRSDEAACGQCNFEQSSCGWSPVQGGRYIWKRHNSSTPTSFNTPTSDHTYGNTQVGNYMFIDASSGSFATDTRLVSPVFGNLSSMCSVSFAYYTNVGPFSSLSLYLYPPNSDPTTTSSSVFYRLWTSSNSVGSQWQNATAGIGSRDPGYRLAFVARNFDRNRGGIAIDDVIFNNCALGQVTQCTSNQFKCARGSCIDITRKCDFSNDCGDNSDEIGCGDYVERCNFETDICNWAQDINDRFDWTWKQGSTATVGTGPNFDHTYGNSSGHYIFIETSTPRLPGDTARLISPVFQANTQANQCQMRFFYHMHGQDINALNVYKENYEMGPRIPVFQKNGSQPDMWIRAMIDLSSSLPFRVVIEGIRGKGYHGDIAIDDVSFTKGCKLSSGSLPQLLTTIGPCGAGKGQCANGQCIKATMFCDFNVDCSDGSDESSCPSTCNFDNGQFCNWQNDLNSNTLNWTIGGNDNPSPSPARDHTTNSAGGKFALVQTQGSNYSRKIARLVSPMYYQAGTACTFTMWYNTNGTGISHLGVYFTQGESYTNIWTVTSTQLRAQQMVWQKATVALPKCPMNFKLTIEVATFGRQVNYVAIDDIAFSQCHYPPPTTSCPSSQFTCNSGNCVPQNLKCDLQRDCCDGSDESQRTCSAYQQCNFEYGLCGWIQSTTDKFDWQRHQGSTNSFGTGPTADHTYGTKTGYYMYIESSRPQRPNDTAQLVYNLNVPTSPCALRLWYHMYGQNIGQLNIYIRTLNQGTVLLKSISDNQNQTWHRLEVNLQSTTPYQVLIEGKVGAGYLGDIAIDDISFTPGCGASGSSSGGFTTPAVSTPASNPCGSSQFSCGDGTCIPLSKVCNFQSDCTDNSDENQCPQTCNFEQDTCGWQELPLDQFDWTRANGISTTSNRNMAPNTDDTYKNQNGYYMYINDKTGGQTQGLVAGLQSSAFKSSNSDCKISFAYYTTGTSLGSLYLYVVENNALTPLWRFIPFRGLDDQWHSVTVGIGRRTTDFNMLFKKSIAHYNGITALDDISFTDCRMRPPVTQCNTVTHFWCSNKVCIPKNKQCDNVDDCGDGSDEGSLTCNGYTRFNFEQGTGNLVQGQNGVDDDFDWSLYAGKTPSSFTGPQWDHTYGNSSGHYLYMEASKQKFNSKAWILTNPFYRTNGRNCVMRMYYFMYGVYINQLSVYSRMYSSGPPTHTLFTRLVLLI